MTQAVVDRLLAEDDVVDVRARAHVAVQRGWYGAARLAPHLAIRLTQLDQRLLERHRCAVEVDADSSAQLLEEPVPRRVADRAEIGQDSLFRLRKLMRAKLSRLLDGVAVARGLGVRIQPLGLLVADGCQLEREEDAVGSALRGRLAHPRQQAARGVILGVLAVEQVRADVRPGSELLVLLELAPHRRAL